MIVDPEDPKHARAFVRLLTVMNDLREQCPWDRKQTIESLRHLTIEETYELGDAILQGDWQELEKELGDLLLHIVFYARIGAEQGVFDMGELIERLCDKLVYRHPHVYGELDAADEDAVRRNWERLKQREPGRKPGVLSGVPASLPALIKALRIQQKAHGIGFDWTSKDDVWQKVEEELREFREQEAADDAVAPSAAAELEFGDLLFTLINYARFVGIDPETALERSNLKFIDRFRRMEQAAEHRGVQLQELSLQALDDLWDQAKAAQAKGSAS